MINIYHDGDEFAVLKEEDMDNDGGQVVLLVVLVQADDLARGDVLGAGVARHHS